MREFLVLHMTGANSSSLESSLVSESAFTFPLSLSWVVFFLSSSTTLKDIKIIKKWLQKYFKWQILSDNFVAKEMLLFQTRNLFIGLFYLCGECCLLLVFFNDGSALLLCCRDLPHEGHPLLGIFVLVLNIACLKIEKIWIWHERRSIFHMWNSIRGKLKS